MVLDNDESPSQGWEKMLATKMLGKSNGIINRIFYKKNGDLRTFFIRYIQHADIERKDELNQVSRSLEENRPEIILIASNHPPLFDQQSGGLRLRGIISALANIRSKEEKSIIFASTQSREQLHPALLEAERRSHYENELKKSGVSLFLYGSNELSYLLSITNTPIKLAILSFPSTAERFLPIIRKLHSETLISYDMVDFHYLRIKREATLQNDHRKARQAKKIKKTELILTQKSDITIAVSEQEKAEIQKINSNAKVKVISNIFEVKKTSSHALTNRTDILFVGGFSHDPNQDAVMYFVKEIWPLLENRIPQCRFIIAGSNPCNRIKELNDNERIRVIGYVPDLASIYRKARVCVAPLRYGAGVKGKVGEALSYGVPVVSTEIGAEGMDVDKHRQMLVGKTSQEFADLIIKLFEDEKIWLNLHEAGKIYTQNNLSEAAARKTLEEIINHTKKK